MPTFADRIKSAWNVFRNGEDDRITFDTIGVGYGTKPDRKRMQLGTERSILASIITRIGVDVSSVPINHVRLDKEGRFLEIIDSTLNNCLSLEANIDQSGRAFIQDVAMSLCDEGVVALVPVDVTIDPRKSSSYDILTIRTGKIVEWYPEHVRVSLYNQRVSRRDEVVVPKTTAAIIENPLYAVMNETNSTLKRLIDKLNLLDAIDNQSGSGKLDLLIQFPYVIKTAERKKQAEARRADIESQLTNTKYGIAYTDATEHVTQLNRPAENNLMGQIEFLTSMLYGQLGLTKEIFDGVADEAAMLNYYNTTVEPILGAITDGMRRTFLTKTARSQGQSIMYLRDPFRLVPVSQIADIADKFTRNEVLSSNELRSIIGRQPSKQTGADELRNKNIQAPDPNTLSTEKEKKPVKKEGES